MRNAPCSRDAPLLDRRAGGGYRGRDRRSTSSSTGSTTSLLVGTGLLAGVVVTALLFRNVADPDVVDVQRVLLIGVSSLVAALSGVLCLLRRRVTGEAPVLWLAAGLLVLAVSRVGALVDAATNPAPPDRVATSVYAAGTVLCVLLVIQALRSAPVDTRFRPLPVLAGTAVATVLLALVFWIGSIDEPVADLTSSRGAGRPIGAALGVCWLAVAGLAMRRARRAGDPMSWPALTAFGLSLAALVPVLARWLDGDPARASLLVEAGAMLCALLGIQSALVRTVGDQQAVLFDTQVEAATFAAQQRAEQEAREERDHDLRSALFAIEGAARTLERHQAALDDDSRHQLARAVASEVTRLQALVRDVDESQTATVFAVADVLAPLLALEITAGVDLRVDLREGITAYGSPSATTEIIRNLLDNARVHAPGTAVRVSAERAGAEVLISVGDEGPGVPERERAAIFERGRRGAGAAAPGSGLGLFVSARLAARQGGRLELVDGPGGACFNLHLPAPTGEAS